MYFGDVFGSCLDSWQKEGMGRIWSSEGVTLKMKMDSTCGRSGIEEGRKEGRCYDGRESEGLDGGCGIVVGYVLACGTGRYGVYLTYLFRN
jgi:hypothetical protein